MAPVRSPHPRCPVSSCSSTLFHQITFYTACLRISCTTGVAMHLRLLPVPRSLGALQHLLKCTASHSH